MPEWGLPALLAGLLFMVAALLYAARRKETARLQDKLHRQKVIAATPDGRCQAQSVSEHLWQWTAVSSDLLLVGVQAAASQSLRALDAERMARGGALTPALRAAAARQRSHQQLMAGHTHLATGEPLALLAALTVDPDGLGDAASTAFEAGALPGADLLDGPSLGVLGDAVPLLGLVGAATRAGRRWQAGQDLRTILGVTAAEAVGRHAGAAAAGKVGALVGSALGPVGTVVGAGLGVLVGGPIGHHVAQHGRRQEMRAWEQALDLEYTAVGTEIAGSPAQVRRVQLDLQDLPRHAHSTLTVVRRAARRQARRPRHWVWPDPQVVLLRAVADCGADATLSLERDMRTLQAFVQAQPPARVAALLAQDPPRCARLGADPDRITRVQDLRRRIQTEQALLR